MANPPCLLCGKPSTTKNLCSSHSRTLGHLTEPELLVYIPRLASNSSVTLHPDLTVEIHRIPVSLKARFEGLPWWFFAVENFYIHLHPDFVPESAVDHGMYYTFLVDDPKECLGPGERCLVRRRGRYFEVRTRTKPPTEDIEDAGTQDCILCHEPATHNRRCAQHQDTTPEAWALQYDGQTIEREPDLGWRIGRDRYRTLPSWVTLIPSFKFRAPRATKGERVGKSNHARVDEIDLQDILLDLEVGPPHVPYARGVIKYETPVVFLRESVEFQRDALRRFITAAEQELSRALV